MIEFGYILLVLTLMAPLALAAIAPLVARPLRFLPWAALPGLAAALLAPAGGKIEITIFLLGLSLELDRVGAVFLGFGSLLWLLAGAYACSYLADDKRVASFSIFWLLTLAGTLGTFVAADIVTFYASFSVMSLAAYGLVVHDRTTSARRAGRIYIVLAVLGETSLVAAFMLAASSADSHSLTDVRAALANSPWSNYVLAGVLVGFGIKAGLVPLHVWLPLAHPEAPTPASAALSGVIVKAGIIGLIRLLPGEGTWLIWGDVLILLGLVTAYYGVVAGLMQTDAKAILAYSTLSQMGLIVTLLGSALGGSDAARTLDAAALYATHHGLAKGALFLSVGVAAASGATMLRPVLAATALTALAIAGLPLSGGALAKLALKGPLGEGTAALLVTVSAVGTALLMLRFLWVLAQRGARDASEAPPWSLLMPWSGMVVAAFALPWVLFSDLTGYLLSYAVSPANVWMALWPILVALAAAVVVLRLQRSSPPTIPQGDIVVVGEVLAHRISSGITRLCAPFVLLAAEYRSFPVSMPLDHFDAAERTLQRWTVSGPALILMAVLIGVVLAI